METSQPVQKKGKERKSQFGMTGTHRQAMLDWFIKHKTLLYKHNATKGLTYQKALEKMSKDLKKQSSEDLALCGNLDVELLTSDELQNRWDPMYRLFSSMVTVW